VTEPILVSQDLSGGGAVHTRGSKIVRRKNEDGASLVEYGLLLALIAVVAFSAVSFFGNGGKGQMSNNAACIGEAMGSSLDGHTCN
jgi:Flp pilus assembly pilin Flp